jgi:hypothetical protein
MLSLSIASTDVSVCGLVWYTRVKVKNAAVGWHLFGMGHPST